VLRLCDGAADFMEFHEIHSRIRFRSGDGSYELQGALQCKNASDCKVYGWRNRPDNVISNSRARPDTIILVGNPN
jgi:hypothetical protein